MSIITTFEHQCRALTSIVSQDDNSSRFLVGTQTPSIENLIYLFEYKDDNNSLAKISYKFPHGEVWHLGASSKYPNLTTCIYGRMGKLNVSLFKLPKELENPIEDDYGLSESCIEKIFDLATDESKLTKQCLWHPDEGDQLLTCRNGCLEFWDLNERQKKAEYSITKAIEKSTDLELNHKSLPPTDIRWSSLFNSSVVAAAIGSNIYGIDKRIPDSSPSSLCWLIEDSKCNRIQSIDFNPNSQYYLASGGDSCRANFWDLRKASQPALHFRPHTHWIWNIRYNPFHDQLVLTAGSDARAALLRVQSLASEPFGQEIDEDDESNSTSEKNQTTVKESIDEVINIYEEHDDSVYAVEWATDPWIFASLGFESRLIINKVPKEEKFNILF